ncbi:MAG TPA: 50S ribosomal protein L23 [Fimbriimonas sp.]
MKNFPYGVIIRPHITEKTVALSYGDEQSAQKRLKNEAKKAGESKKDVQVTEEDLVRKYTFIVANEANKLEIKAAVEAIYNEGKKKEQAITVTSVRTIKVLGKSRRRGRSVGYEPDRKKAIVTLGKGQMLEDYGV